MLQRAVPQVGRAARLLECAPMIACSPRLCIRRDLPLAALLLLLCLVGCGPRKGSAAAAKEADVGALLDLLPPGPSPILFARPRVLFANEVVRSLWTTVVEAKDEQSFVARTGVDPRTLEELVAFELPQAGYLVLARGPFVAREVVERAAERFTLPDVASDAPLFRREGMSGITRYAYVALDAHSVLASKIAPPALVALVLARIADRKAPRAFDAADAAALYNELKNASCVLFAPRPLELPGADKGVALLLAEERALAASASPETGALRVDVKLRGAFPPGAEQNFERLVLSVATSPLGQVLGLSEVGNDLKIARNDVGVALSFSFPAQRLALGLRALFKDDLRDLMR
jgi:hypothetical protein